MLLLFPFLEGTGQELVFKNYTTDNGLPSSEVYTVLQDDDGYLWFSTDHGVCRYDGYRFRTYTTNDGLTDNVVFKMAKGPGKRVWFATYKGGLCYYENGRIRPHPLNDTIINRYYSTSNRIAEIYVDSSGGIWCTTTARLDTILNPTYLYIKNNSIEEINPVKDKYRYHFFYVKFFNNRDYLGSVCTVSGSAPDIVRNDFITVVKTDKANIVYQYFTDGGLTTFCRFNDKLILAYGRNILCSDTKNPGQYTISHVQNNNSCFLNIGDRILLRGTHSGFTVTEAGKPVAAGEAETHYLKGCFISSFAQDHEGNLWITTTNAGIFVTRDLRIKNLTENRDKKYSIRGMEIQDDKVYFCSSRDDVSTIENDGIKTLKSWYTAPSHIANVSSLKARNEREIILSNFYTIRNGKVSEGPYHYLLDVHMYIMNLYVKKILPGDGDTLILGLKTGLAYVDSKKVLYYSADHGFDKVITSLLRQGNDLLIGTISGFYVQDINSKKISRVSGTPDKIYITGIKQYGKEIYAVSKDKGLFLIWKNMNRYEAEKLAGEYPIINCIAADGYGHLWMGTNEGVYIYATDSFKLRLVNKVGKNEGLSSNEIRDIVIKDEKVWLATANDILFADRAALVNRRNYYSPIHIDSTLAINQDKHFASVTDNSLLDYYRRNINVFYTGIFLNEHPENSYLYKVVRDGSVQVDWTPTSNRNLQLTNLSAGDYVIYITTKNQYGLINPLPASFTFTILKHFSQTWWFITAIILAAAAAVFLIVRLIIRDIKKRGLREKMILVSEQKALRAQMNPHFVFNALNSIQFFVTDQDPNAASNYLSKFSKLVRNTLDASSHNFIPLFDEIESIRLYLEIEKLRFGENFNFEIINRLQTDPYDIRIPSMIIQPFVENSIWHGIMPRKGHGKVTICFEEKDDILSCIIDDDGIGRTEAQELNKKRRKGHRSTGMKNIEERIKLINATFNTKMEIRIEDKTNELGDSEGTRVIIIIPLINENRS